MAVEAREMCMGVLAEPRRGRLFANRASAKSRMALQYGDLQSGLGQVSGDYRGVMATADHDGVEGYVGHVRFLTCLYVCLINGLKRSSGRSSRRGRRG